LEVVGNIKATKFIGASDTIFCSKSSSRPEGNKNDCRSNCIRRNCNSYEYHECDRKYGSSDHYLTGGAGSYTLYFTAAECGGTLPNSDYIGTGVRFEICNGFNTWRVNQAPSPGVTIYSWEGPCGHYIFQVLYIRTR